MLTPHCSAASGMAAPASIVSTTRLRKSSEYGFAIHAGLLPVGSLNQIRAGMGNPDSAFSGNALDARNLAYNNVEHVGPDNARKKTEGWTAASKMLREQRPQHLDLAYGNGERNNG